jgi:hypothetical protein
MKPVIAIAAFGFTLTRLFAGQSGESVVRFSNNDHLSGSLQSLTTETLVWNSLILENPTSFRLEKVLDLTMAGEQPDVDSRHEASISLTNGDIVRGQLAGVSDDVVELDTWYAGRMRFNRLMISDIGIAERPILVYKGPLGLDGWKQSGEKPSWIYQNSGFRSIGSGSIARDVKLPEECRVAFDIGWRDSLSLKVVVFSDDLASDRPSTGYELSFQQRTISLRSCNGSRFIGQSSHVVSLQENEKGHVEIRASRKSGKVSLYLDGKGIENWDDPDLAHSAFGSGIHFISQGSSPVHVSRIEAGIWDGETEKIVTARMRALNRFRIEMADDSEPEPEEKTAPGRMELRNGDSLVGEVLSIGNGAINLKTTFREVKLPIEAFRSLSLKPVDLERCIRKNGDVRAWFPDGSSLVFRLDEAGEETISGFSQNFGNATFKMAAFNRIEFNIYDRDLMDIREARNW